MALAEILAAKRQRLKNHPPRDLPASRARRDIGLQTALNRPWPGFILECKAASPSAGVLVPDYDPAGLAGAYEGMADAVSVLTEPEFFGGELAHLTRVRARLKDVPLLRKDFILGPDEVMEARAYGADAVLLMLSVLEDADWRACHEACLALGMDALTEVHDRGELERALALGAPIIGINNRDLKTLQVDLGVTERLARLIPEDRLVVCESGIASRDDVLRLAPLIDWFLVGTRLSRGGRPDQSARTLVVGRVKVCGLTRPEDALVAWQAGATFGGLIFAPDSPRRIDRDTATGVQSAAPLLDWVGVFRDQAVGEVSHLARSLGLSAVQLHGNEDGAYARELRDRLPAGCEIWKAVPGRAPLTSSCAFAADRLLLDSGPEGRLGGSGRVFDAEALADVDIGGHVLAGGIRPENVERAARLGGWMIDVNSGVEQAPGIKDAALLKALFTRLRSLPGKRSQA
jgi:indole-3-glycerol phosphate synthase / phosphoribosylanthranilate isomerase